jgi:hypothetical protein
MPEMTPAGPSLQRDRDVLLAIIQHRFLSYQQVRTLLFSDVHRSVVGRRIQALTESEWLKSWEDRVERGGHPRYALPTKKGLMWARRTLLAQTVEAPHRKIVATMLRDRSPAPLTFTTYPNYLAHQRELNDVLIALERAGIDLSWASTWHRPFPNTLNGSPLPQPDAVLVLKTPNGARLVFLEHDRATEAPGTFQADKADRYAALAHLRSNLFDLTGFSSFDVLVTIHAADPLARIAALQEAVRTTMGAAPLFRFTPDAWLFDAPTDAIWFGTRTPINRTATSFRGQAGLLALPGSIGA